MNRSTLIKSGIFILWLVLIILLIKRDILVDSVDIKETQALERAARQEFQGVYFQNRKIGYVQSSYSFNEDSSYRIDQKGFMVLNILDTRQPVNFSLSAQLDETNNLQKFSVALYSPFYRMNGEGFVNNRQVHFTLTTNNSVIKDTVVLRNPPMLPTNRRGYLLKTDLQIGDKIQIPRFDPITLTGKSSVVEYKGREKILINKRVFNLHRFLERVQGTRINFWLDDDGNVVKEQSPVGFVFIREPEFRATRLDESSGELLSAVSVKPTGKMESLKNRQSIRYRLQLTELDSFDMDGGRQTLSGNILTISNEKAAKNSTRLPTACPQNGSALGSTPTVQADHPKISVLSKQIIGKETDPLRKVTLLAEWVHTNIQKRPVVGLPDALTTLVNRVGDCNEHAALFAALARNIGIPTRLAAGVTYHKNSFYYHAWNEVCVDGRWLSLDTTMGQLPADLTHIRFITGGLKEQLRIGGLLGQLAIEILGDDHSQHQER